MRPGRVIDEHRQLDLSLEKDEKYLLGGEVENEREGGDDGVVVEEEETEDRGEEGEAEEVGETLLSAVVDTDGEAAAAWEGWERLCRPLLHLAYDIDCIFEEKMRKKEEIP